MQQLHLVGFTTDLDSLIFSARRGSKSGGYVVPLDDQLLEVVAEALKMRRAAAGEEAESALERALAAESRAPRRQESWLTPREIQARLRAGRTIEAVAAEAGVDEDWVERWAAPVFAERAQIIQRARALVFSTSRKGDSAEALGVSVRWNVADRGVRLTEDEFEQRWSAYQLQDEIWVVRFEFVSRGRQQVAEWTFDVSERTLASRNRLASDLGMLDAARRRRQPPEFAAPARRSDTSEEREGTAPSTRKAAKKRGRPKKSSKKTTAKKSTAKKTTAKKSTAKKTTAKKTTAKKTTAKKSTAKKAGGRKAATTRDTRKAAAKKAAAKKAAPKKAAAKKTPRKKRAATKKAAARKSPRSTKRTGPPEPTRPSFYAPPQRLQSSPRPSVPQQRPPAPEAARRDRQAQREERRRRREEATQAIEDEAPQIEHAARERHGDGEEQRPAASAESPTEVVSTDAEVEDRVVRINAAQVGGERQPRRRSSSEGEVRRLQSTPLRPAIPVNRPRRRRWRRS